ncbi:NineTeen Complex (NTC) component [Apophysomyces sp. BC1034]|nr:NineTeen Complex (NTC) component [Apophysomyces sp. BC1034]
MARNEEKAQSMLYRFREAQAAELGLVRKRERRPALASSVSTIGECERWRRDLLGEIARKVSKIQDVSLSDYQVRDLNDDINRLMREKYHWERRIRELGGADYSRAGPRMILTEGKEVPAPQPEGRSRAEIYKNIDADYYGYRDEEDDALLEYEREREEDLVEHISQMPDIAEPEEGEEEREPMDLDALNTEIGSVPNQKQVEEYLVNRRRQQLLDKYVSDDLKQSEQETKVLTGME